MTPLKNRRSIRLKGYDYTRQGLYFITICTQNRANAFGTIKDNRVELNETGRMIETTWNEIPEFYSGFDIHEFVVMPNHIHGIIEIVDCDIAETSPGTARREPEKECVDNGMAEITGWVITDDAGTGQTRGSAPTVMVSSDIPGQSIINGPNHVGATPRGCPMGTPGCPAGTPGCPAGTPGCPVAPSSCPVASAGANPAQPPHITRLSIPDIVHRFKTLTTKRYADGVKRQGWPPFPGRLWQRNYYEHIIRDEQSYRRIAEYIINNPANWREDDYFDA